MWPFPGMIDAVPATQVMLPPVSRWSRHGMGGLLQYRKPSIVAFCRSSLVLVELNTASADCSHGVEKGESLLQEVSIRHYVNV